MKRDNPKIDQLKLVIGLYCGWTLSAEKYTKLLLEKILLWNQLSKWIFRQGKIFWSSTLMKEWKSIPFDEVQNCIREACRYCMDSTAEYADVSVGSARFAGNWEEVRQWNQLIVRTDKGRDFVELGRKKRSSGSAGSPCGKFEGTERRGRQ